MYMRGLQEKSPKGVEADVNISAADEVQNGGGKGEILGVVIYV